MAQINIIDYNKIVYFDENTGNYKIFDGERWWLSDDKFGTSTTPSGVALVDSAIVDTSVVGEEEAPAMQTIWEGTFTPTEEEETQIGTVYSYMTEDVQNAELLRNVSEVNVTFDGTPYTLPVVFDVDRYVVGTFDEPNATPFMFVYDIYEEPYFVGVSTLTDGSHTIKIEGTPVEPSSEVLYENTFTPETEIDTETASEKYIYSADNLQNVGKIITDSLNTVKVTFDDVPYILPVITEEYEGDITCDIGDSDFDICPFIIYLRKFTLETEVTTLTVGTETGGEHTIKIETTDETAEIPGGGILINPPAGQQ